jgi:hypothetical protein
MDENEDLKAPSATPETAGDPASSAALPPGEAAIEAKAELASIESPPLAPTIAEMTAKAEPAAPKVEPPTEKFEQVEPRGPQDAAARAREIVPFTAAAAAGRASWTFSKFTLLAAAGVLGATSVARLAGEPAPTPAQDPTAPLQTTLAQLRSDIAALKTSVDATSRTAGTQYSKLVERLDRAERAQTVATKTDAALSKETTGSITPPPSAAAAPLSPVPVPSSGIAPGVTVPGWAVRDVYRGVAMLQSRMGGMVEVEPGDVLPGLGRIESIRRQDGRWVVTTSKGMITSLR